MTSSTSPESSTKTLTAKCYCGDVHYNLNVPKSILPLEVHLCHCSICRYASGTFCVFHSSLLPEGVAPEWIAPSSMDKVTAYRHPEGKAVRYSCSTCGCHIGDQGIGHKRWVISTSIFDANRGESSDIWDIKEHIYTSPESGGGLFHWLPSTTEKKMAMYDYDTDQQPSDIGTLSASRTSAAGDQKDPNRLRVECCCGGVSFTISRPTPAMQQDPNYKRWLCPNDPNKWLGTVDACDDCRLLSGSHVMGWTFIPLSCISPAFPDDMKIGTSKTYSSSEGVLRSFCGTCGATVAGDFNQGGKRELSNGDKVVDIAAGLLRAPEGALAENWVGWRTGRLSFQQDGKRYDASLAQGLADGIAAWGKKKDGEVLDLEIS